MGREDQGSAAGVGRPPSPSAEGRWRTTPSWRWAIGVDGPQALVLLDQLFDVEDSAARVDPHVRDAQARWTWLGLISTCPGSLTGRAHDSATGAHVAGGALPHELRCNVPGPLQEWVSRAMHGSHHGREGVSQRSTVALHERTRGPCRRFWKARWRVVRPGKSFPSRCGPAGGTGPGAASRATEGVALSCAPFLDPRRS